MVKRSGCIGDSGFQDEKSKSVGLRLSHESRQRSRAAPEGPPAHCAVARIHPPERALSADTKLLAPRLGLDVAAGVEDRPEDRGADLAPVRQGTVQRGGGLLAQPDLDGPVTGLLEQE